MTKLIITFQQEGVHCWPDGTELLKHPHRHVFHFRVELKASADNSRRLEFLDLKEHCKQILNFQWGRYVGKSLYTLDFENNSCEVIAASLLEKLCDGPQLPVVAVECWEDGENGARVEL